MQTVHGCEKLRPFALGLGPFSGPWKKSAGMQPTLFVTTSTVIWAGQILCQSKFKRAVPRLHRPPSPSWLLRGGLAIAPTSIAVAKSSKRSSHRVPVVKTSFLISLWLMTGLLEILSLFLSRPPQALFARWAQTVFIMPVPIKRQRTWNGLDSQGPQFHPSPLERQFRRAPSSYSS